MSNRGGHHFEGKSFQILHSFAYAVRMFTLKTLEMQKAERGSQLELGVSILMCARGD
jgi:hypothetical protein